MSSNKLWTVKWPGVFVPLCLQPVACGPLPSTPGRAAGTSCTFLSHRCGTEDHVQAVTKLQSSVKLLQKVIGL